MKKSFIMTALLLSVIPHFLMSQVTVTIGTGTQISSLVYSAITPYKTYYYDGQDQILFTAAELSAAGLGAGPITSLGFNVGGTPDADT